MGAPEAGAPHSPRSTSPTAGLDRSTGCCDSAAGDRDTGRVVPAARAHKGFRDLRQQTRASLYPDNQHRRLCRHDIRTAGDPAVVCSDRGVPSVTLPLGCKSRPRGPGLANSITLRPGSVASRYPAAPLCLGSLEIREAPLGRDRVYLCTVRYALLLGVAAGNEVRHGVLTYPFGIPDVGRRLRSRAGFAKRARSHSELNTVELVQRSAGSQPSDRSCLIATGRHHEEECEYARRPRETGNQGYPKVRRSWSAEPKCASTVIDPK